MCPQMNTLILVLFTFLLPLSLAAQQETFAGAYSSDGDIVQLQLTYQDNTYSGTLYVQGQSYPFTGKLTMGMIVGTYRYEGADIDILMANIDGQYYLESEGMTVQMFKKENSIDPDKVVGTETLPDPGPLKAATGKSLKDPGGAFTFKAPAGWQEHEKEGAYVIVNSQLKKEVYLIVSPHQHSDLTSITKEIEPHFDAENNTYLTGQYKFLKDQLWVRYTGKSQGNEVTIHTLFIKSPYDGGAQLVAIVEGEDEGLSMFNQLRSMAATFNFVKITISPAASKWDKMIRGKQLLYMRTSGGISDKWSYDLCSDGTFVYKGRTSGMSGGVSTLSYVGANNNSGTWKITSQGVSALLNLYYRDGSVGQMTITDKDNSTAQLLLNGKRYFIQPNNSCR